MASAYVTNLPPPPYQCPIEVSPGVMATEWIRWFGLIWNRVGASTGDTIYDALDNAQSTAASEAQLFATRAELEQALQGAILQIIEQIKDTQPDPAALMSERAQIPYEQYPEDIPLAGILQATYDSAPVQSVFGRIGYITAIEGDYNLTQLGDVTITAPGSNEVLKYNGTTWVNSTVPAGGLSGVVPIANGGTGESNAIDAFQALSPLTTSGDIIIQSGGSIIRLPVGSNGDILTVSAGLPSWQPPAAVVTAPDGDAIVATVGQTVFNTTCNTAANAAGKYYLQVTKNGLVLNEGALNDYTVTGATQVTLTAGALLGDILTFRSWS